MGTLTDKPKEDGFWEGRQVEWAVGTDYVWVGGSEYEEIYVVDIVKKMVVKTITGIDAEQMVSVNNVEREQQAMMIENSEYSTSSGYAMPSTSSTKTLKEEGSYSN